ncbi:MAG: hypothetical protein AABY13_00225, partial [Nanoarchaeota archaeon]
MRRDTAFMFDVDGVLADTPQEAAWYLAAEARGMASSREEFARFYAAHVSGQPGLLGARVMLEGLRFPDGRTYVERCGIVDELDLCKEAMAFRTEKQHCLQALLQAGPLREYADTIGIAIEARRRGHPVMAVSSSESAQAVLERLASSNNELKGVFDTTALGTITHWHGANIAKEHHYAMAYGKLIQKSGYIPRPIVFDDAPTGMAAIKRLGFTGVGIARNV